MGANFATPLVRAQYDEAVFWWLRTNKSAHETNNQTLDTLGLYLWYHSHANPNVPLVYPLPLDLTLEENYCKAQKNTFRRFVKDPLRGNRDVVCFVLLTGHCVSMYLTPDPTGKTIKAFLMDPNDPMSNCGAETRRAFSAELVELDELVGSLNETTTVTPQQQLPNLRTVDCENVLGVYKAHLFSQCAFEEEICIKTSKLGKSLCVMLSCAFVVTCVHHIRSGHFCEDWYAISQTCDDRDRLSRCVTGLLQVMVFLQGLMSSPSRPIRHIGLDKITDVHAFTQTFVGMLEDSLSHTEQLKLSAVFATTDNGLQIKIVPVDVNRKLPNNSTYTPYTKDINSFKHVSEWKTANKTFFWHLIQGIIQEQGLAGIIMFGLFRDSVPTNENANASCRILSDETDVYANVIKNATDKGDDYVSKKLSMRIVKLQKQVETLKQANVELDKNLTKLKSTCSTLQQQLPDEANTTAELQHLKTTVAEMNEYFKKIEDTKTELRKELAQHKAANWELQQQIDTIKDCPQDLLVAQTENMFLGAKLENATATMQELEEVKSAMRERLQKAATYSAHFAHEQTTWLASLG